MQFKTAFLARRSVRKYRKKEVPLSLVGEILDLARYAPSSGNLQNWRILVVTDKRLRNQVADACLQQTWMVDAPVHLIICNDYEDCKKHYGKLGKMFSIQNCATVAYAITLIATEYGLSSCWVGAFDNVAIQRIFNIPEDVDPEIVITIGYASETKKPSLREDLQYLAFFNKWGSPLAEVPSHIEMFKKKIKRKS